MVVNSGAPVLMPWADRVAAVLQVWFPGQEFGHAAGRRAARAAEPAGRLPVTVPRAEASGPGGLSAAAGAVGSAGPAVPVDGLLEYREGLLVGYRGYDRAGVEPLYPFGYGLGYTDWVFEALDVPLGPVRPGRGRGGDRDRAQHRRAARPDRRAGLPVGVGAAAAGPVRPLRALAAFEGVEADPGEAASVRIRVPARAFAHWDEEKHDWVHAVGRFTLHAGASSRDLRLASPVEVA